MRPEDVRYYTARAEQQMDLAQQASHPEAVRAHFMLASRYLDLVYDSPFAPEKEVAPVWR
jgi:hypothetical protein